MPSLYLYVSFGFIYAYWIISKLNQIPYSLPLAVYFTVLLILMDVGKTEISATPFCLESYAKIQFASQPTGMAHHV